MRNAGDGDVDVDVDVDGGPATAPFTFTSTSSSIFLLRDDPFFEDGDIHRHLYLRNATSGAGEMERPKVSEFCCHIAGCSQLFDTLENYEHHYNAFHRNVCSSCKRSFPSTHLLDIHILEWHDSLFQIMAAKQSMYQCLIESCTEKFKTFSDRKKHLVKVHGYPSDFRFDKPKKLTRHQKNQDRSPHDMEVEATVCQKETKDIFCRTTIEQPMDQESGETMEAENPAVLERSSITTVPQRLSSSCRVPATICFGHGSIRGFKNTRRKK
ncbi:LOW QUALITY PROTEIN: zinc finger protein 511 [Leucoraja erinacea]|uniref:LOW QUALITY PROTEIN: zinc finger protein 511 n=1 Tax=Leucoraja erinaceus TaxID=7782 RepID=UPI0024588877|nr:LOW QUALITY PROTEIN: zinc finger protein 511 [Leucoraja erinacea]